MYGNNEQAQEIIIIKRSSHGDEGHHGGAWKIAFADFMTAMMALFLVLWLINAANEETRMAVASYFNPVKLVERNESKRGLDEQTGGPTKIENGGGLPTDESTQDKETRQQQEKRFFDDPFTALAQIAEKKTDRAISLAQGQGGGSGEDNPSSPFPDPFGPDFAGQAEALGDLTQPGPIEVALADAMAPGQEQPRDGGKGVAKATAKEGMPGDDTNAKADKNAQAMMRDGDNAEANAAAAQAAKTSAADEKRADAQSKKIEAVSKKLHDEIVKVLGADKNLSATVNKALEVKAVDDGVLISVTDKLGFSMFEIGSAVPLKQTVMAMDGIAKVLAANKGQLRVYGHTDARAFATPDDDNWRLSAARAHAAYFMLVRGGVKEGRFSQISGFADRQLKKPDDPNADVNRRIEIFLEVK